MTSVSFSLEYLKDYPYFKKTMEIIRKLDYEGSNMNIQGYDERNRMRSVSIPKSYISDSGFDLTIHVYDNGYYQAIKSEDIEKISNSFTDKFVTISQEGNDIHMKFERRPSK